MEIDTSRKSSAARCFVHFSQLGLSKQFLVTWWMESTFAETSLLPSLDYEVPDYSYGYLKNSNKTIWKFDAPC